MHALWTICRREVSAFFNSLTAYLFIGVFLAGVGLFFWIFPENILETGAANMDTLFGMAPWFFLFLAPAITMRAFSEEFKTGTFEFLSTKPVTLWQIVLGKYLAAALLVVFSLVPTLLWYITIYVYGDPPGSLDSGAIWGAYLGLLGIGWVFAAIGLFASSLTDNQIVSFVLGAFLCFVFFAAFEFLADVALSGKNAEGVLLIGIMEHYRSISRGVIDSRDVLYYASLIGGFLYLSKMTLSLRKQ